MVLKEKKHVFIRYTKIILTRPQFEDIITYINGPTPIVAKALPFVAHYVCLNNTSGTLEHCQVFHQIETPPLEKKNIKHSTCYSESHMKLKAKQEKV